MSIDRRMLRSHYSHLSSVVSSSIHVTRLVHVFTSDSIPKLLWSMSLSFLQIYSTFDHLASWSDLCFTIFDEQFSEYTWADCHLYLVGWDCNNHNPFPFDLKCPGILSIRYRIFMWREISSKPKVIPIF